LDEISATFIVRSLTGMFPFLDRDHCLRDSGLEDNPCEFRCGLSCRSVSKPLLLPHLLGSFLLEVLLFGVGVRRASRRLGVSSFPTGSKSSSRLDGLALVVLAVDAH
jgi:hypothetical protein